MKDFKQTPKMNAEGSHYCKGGKVKKMAEGGSTDSGYSFDKNDYHNMGAKTPIGAQVAKNVLNNTLTRIEPEETKRNRVAQYRDEADSEVQREHTRGIQTKKRGGSVKRKK